MAGIVSYGAYIPYYRLPRSVISKAWGQPGGRGEIAVANYDEDPISMSVAAGMDSLRGIDPKTVDALFLATTTAPYKERQNSTIAATALDLSRETRNADFTNCLRAGTTAMLSALDAANAGSAKSIMVTAADMRLGAPSGDNEQNFGNGAAAFLVGKERVIADIEGSYTISEDMADTWRAHDEVFVRNWEERFGREEGYSKIPIEAAAGVMKQCGLTPKDFAKACFYGSNSRAHRALGKSMGFTPEQIQEPLLDTVGNTGAALPLMILVAALEDAKAGDRLLLCSWGNGCDAIVLKVTDEIEKIRDRRGIKRHLDIKRTLDNYEKLLRWRGTVPMEAAARPAKSPTSMSSLWREHRSALPLYGVKCKKCGTAQLFMDFASTRARVCLECFAKDEFEPYRFATKKGKVASFSHDYLALSQDPPNTLTVVDFDGGGRGSFEMTDRDPEECQVGMEVEMTFRKIFFDKGVHNYFWKCKPARD
ncbi:MAG: OB-fold domain-containing protein [Chloroflexota bacterium]|nr:MAG: OB-fold domain-containing protein [Chloroflexota bacterium]